jgi:hypothetical protein
MWQNNECGLIKFFARECTKCCMIPVNGLEMFSSSAFHHAVCDQFTKYCWPNQDSVSRNQKNPSVATCVWKVMRNVMQDYWVQKTVIPAVISTASWVATRELCAVTSIPHAARAVSLCERERNAVMLSQPLVSRNQSVQELHQSALVVWQWQMEHPVWRGGSVGGESVCHTVRPRVFKAACVTSVSTEYHGLFSVSSILCFTSLA